MNLAIIVAVAFILTFFAFKTTSFLFRAAAASSWLTIIIYTLSDDKTLDISHPWTVVLIATLFLAMCGALLLYIGKEITSQGWIIGKTKDARPRRQRVQEDYKSLLQSKTNKYWDRRKK